ncbi:hypothetical protein AAMO2058_000061400 [Amorphochlora amoebiformis]
MRRGETPSQFFKRTFKFHLREITNARANIWNLTEIARLYVHYCPEVRAAIAETIKEEPNRRIPIVYLIDSIAKICGDPYVILFAPMVYEAFMSSYKLATDSVQRKLARVLSTWEQANLWRMETQRIRRVIGHPPTERKIMERKGPAESKMESVLEELERRYINSRPDLKPHFERIKKLAEQGVNIQQSVLQLTAAIGKKRKKRAVREAAKIPDTQRSGQLLTSLNKLLADGTTAQAAWGKSAVGNKPAELEPPKGDEWKRVWLKRRRNKVIRLMSMGQQCTTCGLRFTDEAAREAHLDRHFRINTRRKRQQGRVIAREWYMEIPEWASLEDPTLVETKALQLRESSEDEYEPKPVLKLIADETQKRCNQCDDVFEKRFDPEKVTVTITTITLTVPLAIAPTVALFLERANCSAICSAR